MDRITAAELADLLATRPVALLDVRTAAEYEAAHIPGSIRVSLDELREEVDTVAALLPDHAVIVCRSGGRAEQACRALASSGRDDLRILDGGIQAWERAGRSVARGRARWALERQVRLVAGTLVSAGVVVGVVWPPALLVPAASASGWRWLRWPTAVPWACSSPSCRTTAPPPARRLASPSASPQRDAEPEPTDRSRDGVHLPSRGRCRGGTTGDPRGLQPQLAHQAIGVDARVAIAAP